MSSPIRSILVSLPVALGVGAVSAQSAKPPAAPPAPRVQPADPAAAAQCTHTAKSMIGALDHGDVATATRAFDPKLHKQLTGDALRKGWSSLADKFGKRAGFGAAQSQKVNGVTVVLLPMTYARGELGAEVACDAKGAVVAVHVGQMPPAQGKASPGMASPPPTGG